MSVKVIVYDFDGVLVDSNQIKQDAYIIAFQRLGVDLTEDCVKSAQRSGGNRFQVIDVLWNRLASEQRLPLRQTKEEAEKKLALDYDKICTDYAATCSEISGAENALRKISLKYPQYVNSATLEASLVSIIERRGWRPLFKGVLGSPASKTANLNFIFVAESVTPKEVLFVGDGYRDVAAAKETGCQFVGIRNAFNDFDTSSVTMLDDFTPFEKVAEALGLINV